MVLFGMLTSTLFGAHLRLPPGKWEYFQTELTMLTQSAVIQLQKFLPKMAKMPRTRVVFMLSSYVYGVAPKYMS
jgi:hypothetical protein